MSTYQTILTSSAGPVGTISLNRPEVHQAMNIEMIRELNDAIHAMDSDGSIRVIVLRSAGANFSAGADIKWMKEGMKQSRDQVMQESRELAGLFKRITHIPSLFISSVRGKVIGGANGLVAASDLVISEKSALFSFSEVKLGLIPATIAPFVIEKVGKSRAALWMMSGEPFSAMEAWERGLVHRLCEEGELELKTETLVTRLLSNGPGAISGIKKMLREFDFHGSADEIEEQTAEIISQFRISPEGQEGMKAFLEKRKPDWDVS